MKPRHNPLHVGLLLLLGLPHGCDLNTHTYAKDLAPAQEPTAKVAATVNGTVITQDQVDRFLASKKIEQPNTQQNLAQALDEMIILEVLKQHAQKAGIHERAEIISQLDQHRTNLLINTFLSEYSAELSFTDEQLQNEYNKQTAAMAAKEYKARHILANSEDDAKQIIKNLNAGADFIALAKAKSTGPSGPQGGDLGWFTTETMISPFAQAVKQMEKGSYTREPIKTRYGWHVILLEDQRELKAPSFMDMKDKLRVSLTNQALQAYVGQLRKDAQIEIK